MKPAPESFFIGWDVGGWNCEHNQKSRDAIVILESDLSVVGSPWRGNLRVTINEAKTAQDWIQRMFHLCKAEFLGTPSITMAIDTPLGFSEEFIDLVAGGLPVPDIQGMSTNRYLYRQTERHLFEKGLSPLSAVKDMIGSQATKGIHALSKFAPNIEDCGVWSDGHGFRAIEAYPSAARKTVTMQGLLKGLASLGHADLDDARICALIAHLFADDRETLEQPRVDVSMREGWIWVPKV